MDLRVRELVMAALATVAAAGVAGAQKSSAGVVEGVVVSVLSGAPVEGALVVLDDGRRITTRADGRFVFENTPAGEYRIAAVAPGCDAAVGEVRVGPGAEVALQMAVLPRVPPEVALSTVGYATMGDGVAVRVLTGSDLRRLRATSAQDAIRVIAPDMIGSGPGTPGYSRLQGGRGRNSINGPITPLLVIDGARVSGDPGEVLAAIHPEDIARIEIVRGPSGGWAHGFDSANGVIRVYTRRSEEGDEPVLSAEECGFRFPARSTRVGFLLPGSANDVLDTILAAAYD